MTIFPTGDGKIMQNNIEDAELYRTTVVNSFVSQIEKFL